MPIWEEEIQFDPEDTNPYVKTVDQLQFPCLADRADQKNHFFQKNCRTRSLSHFNS